MFNSNSCVICGDSITDPVCINCYIKQIEVLLNDLEFHPIAKEIILKKIKDRFPTETLNDTKCILCQRENVTMCRYCFSVLFTNILRELNFTENLIKKFGFNPILEEISLKRKVKPKIEMIL